MLLFFSIPHYVMNKSYNLLNSGIQHANTYVTEVTLSIKLLNSYLMLNTQSRP